MIKLDIGSGGPANEHLGPKWIGVDAHNPDADICAEMGSLPYRDNSVDAIFSSHALEHIPKAQVLSTLKEWRRVIKPGSIIEIRIPDLIYCCKRSLENPNNGEELDRIYGQQWGPGQLHQTGFTEQIFRDYAAQAELSVLSFKRIWSHDQETLVFEVTKHV